MAGSFLSPAGEACAVVQIDPSTDTVIRAYGASVAVVTPNTSYDVTISPDVASAPDAGCASVHAQGYSGFGAAARSFVYDAPLPRTFRVTAVDVTGAPAALVSTRLTVTVYRAAIPGA